MSASCDLTILQLLLIVTLVTLIKQSVFPSILAHHESRTDCLARLASLRRKESFPRQDSTLGRPGQGMTTSRSEDHAAETSRQQDHRPSLAAQLHRTRPSAASRISGSSWRAQPRASSPVEIFPVARARPVRERGRRGGQRTGYGIRDRRSKNLQPDDDHDNQLGCLALSTIHPRVFAWILGCRSDHLNRSCSTHSCLQARPVSVLNRGRLSRWHRSCPSRVTSFLSLPIGNPPPQIMIYYDYIAPRVLHHVSRRSAVDTQCDASQVLRCDTDRTECGRCTAIRE